MIMICSILFMYYSGLVFILLFVKLIFIVCSLCELQVTVPS